MYCVAKICIKYRKHWKSYVSFQLSGQIGLIWAVRNYSPNWQQFPHVRHMKNCPLLGKLLSVWRAIHYCPNQPDLPRQLKTHIVFSMFPILDTNLCIRFKAAAIQCGNRTYKSLVQSGVLNYFYVFLVHPLHYPYIYYYNSYFFIA